MSTISIEANGFGAMYQSIISGLAYCRKNKIEYLHTDLHTVHRTDPTQCNNIIGMHSYKKANAYTPKIDYTRDIWGANPNELFTDEVIEEIRNNYKGNKNLINCICIHIRRGDIDPKIHINRWDNLSKYISVIEYFKNKYHLPIVIVSEATKKELTEILDRFPDITINNESTLEAFNLMVNCKILFIARSSFSYVAGILNRNTVVATAIDYNRWFCKPFKNWSFIPNINF